jgi:hypothetical protein
MDELCSALNPIAPNAEELVDLLTERFNTAIHNAAGDSPLGP